MTLQQLHLTVQDVMGSDNYPMHSWTIAGVDYGQSQPDSHVRSENSVKLTQVVKGEKFKFSYT